MKYKLKFQQGNKIPRIKTFDEFVNYYDKDPEDKLYNIKRAYEIYKLYPDQFEDPELGLASKEEDGWHFSSVDPHTNTFLKHKNHPTIHKELEWYNSPLGADFKSRFNLDQSGDYYRYIPKHQQGGSIKKSYKSITNFNDLNLNTKPFSVSERMKEDEFDSIKDNVIKNNNIIQDRFYQKKGVADNKVKSVKQFYTDYLNSPNYKKRLAASDPMHLTTAWARKNNLNDIKLTKSDYDSFTPRTNTIAMNEDSDTVLAHEFSHGLGSLAPDNMIVANGINQYLTSMNRKDYGAIQSRNRLHQLDYKKRVGSEGVSPSNFNFEQAVLSHEADPVENKADMDALRYQLKKDGIYDTGTQTFDKKTLDKIKTLPKYNKNPMFNRLFKIIKDDDLIWMMNNIANVAKNNNIIYAQQGSKIPSIKDYFNNVIQSGVQQAKNVGNAYMKMNQENMDNLAIPAKAVNYAAQKGVQAIAKRTHGLTDNDMPEARWEVPSETINRTGMPHRNLNWVESMGIDMALDPSTYISGKAVANLVNKTVPRAASKIAPKVTKRVIPKVESAAKEIIPPTIVPEPKPTQWAENFINNPDISDIADPTIFKPNGSKKPSVDASKFNRVNPNEDWSHFEKVSEPLLSSMPPNARQRFNQLKNEGAAYNEIALIIQRENLDHMNMQPKPMNNVRYYEDNIDNIKGFIKKHNIQPLDNLEEMSTQRAYVTAHHSSMNNRVGDLTPTYGKIINEMGDQFESMILKNKAQEPFTVRRGVQDFPTTVIRNGEPVQIKYSEMQVGDVFEPKSFTSTSINPDFNDSSFASNLMQDIKIPGGGKQSIFYPNRTKSMSAFPAEQEIVLPRNLKFRIDDIKIDGDKKTFIKSILNPYLNLGVMGATGAAAASKIKDTE